MNLMNVFCVCWLDLVCSGGSFCSQCVSQLPIPKPAKNTIYCGFKYPHTTIYRNSCKFDFARMVWYYNATRTEHQTKPRKQGIKGVGCPTR